MVDVVSRRRRSEMMSHIHGSDTRPELVVRRALHKAGFRYRLHQPDLPGRPDLVLKRYRAAIFVHGCFWHRHRGCRFAYSPKSHSKFWSEKFRRNSARDRRQFNELANADWRVLVVWECAVRPPADHSKTIKSIARWLNSRASRAEIVSEK